MAYTALVNGIPVVGTFGTLRDARNTAIAMGYLPSEVVTRWVGPPRA